MKFSSDAVFEYENRLRKLVKFVVHDYLVAEMALPDKNDDMDS